MPGILSKVSCIVNQGTLMGLLRAVEDAGMALPTVVVLGPESSGKSTLLNRVVGVQVFPTAEEICTRMVIRVYLRPGDASCKLSVWRRGANAGLVAGSEQEVSIERTEEIVRTAMTAACGATADIVEDLELRVHLRRPDFPLLNLLDLPGVTSAGATKESSKRLAETVIAEEKERATFLLVHRSLDRLVNNVAASLVDASGVTLRTLGVITMMDQAIKLQQARRLMERIDTDADLRKVVNQWFFSASPNDDRGAALDAIENMEASLVGTVQGATNGDRFGIPALQAQLKKEFDAFLIAEYFPNLLSLLGRRRQDLFCQLLGMGLPIPLDP